MYSLANSGKYEKYIQLSPIFLYARLLRSSIITYGPNCRKLIRITLVIPPSSVSSERLNCILTRSSLLIVGKFGDLVRVAENEDAVVLSLEFDCCVYDDVQLTGIIDEYVFLYASSKNVL